MPDNLLSGTRRAETAETIQNTVDGINDRKRHRRRIERENRTSVKRKPGAARRAFIFDASLQARWRTRLALFFNRGAMRCMPRPTNTKI